MQPAVWTESCHIVVALPWMSRDHHHVTVNCMQGTPKKFVQVVQPGEGNIALAIVVDATGRAGNAARFPVGKEAETSSQQPLSPQQLQSTQQPQPAAHLSR